MCILAEAAVFALTGVSSSYLALVVALFGFGCVTTISNILIWTYRHEITPAPLIGRVSGITGSIFKLGMPFALFGSGYFAAAAGAQPVFLACGLLQCAIFVAFAVSAVMHEK